MKKVGFRLRVFRRTKTTFHASSEDTFASTALPILHHQAGTGGIRSPHSQEISYHMGTIFLIPSVVFSFSFSVHLILIKKKYS